jgi:4-hydroxybenzoate polyprenyltransferase
MIYSNMGSDLKSAQAVRSRDGAPVTEPAIVRLLRLIRFSHTVFALPFALGSLLVAANGRPTPRVFFLVLICMVFARTAAMLFNRLVDWSLDQRNPRTEGRHRLMRRPVLLALLAGSTLGFIFTAACINFLTALLAPGALLLIFLYSLTKRFTSATHFFLGAALGAAPIGAWIAQTGDVGLPPLVLACGVICWVAGFDLIYATQDLEFDRKEGLHSLVVRLGISRSLRLAQWLHLGMFGALILFGRSAHLGVAYYGAMPVVAAALFYEHRSASSLDLVGINRAFFNSNALVSAVFLAAVCLDQFL